MKGVVLWIDELDRYNAGVKRAVMANRNRERWERFLEALGAGVGRQDR